MIAKLLNSTELGFQHGDVGDCFLGREDPGAARMRITIDPVDVSAALRQMKRRSSRLGRIENSHPRPLTQLSISILLRRRLWELST